MIRCLENLDPEIVIHRMTGDGPEKLLLAPLWTGRKREVLNLLHHQMKVCDSWQGKRSILCQNKKEVTEMADPFTTYKLIVLYMAKCSDRGTDKFTDFRIYPGSGIYRLFSASESTVRADGDRTSPQKNDLQQFLL